MREYNQNRKALRFIEETEEGLLQRYRFAVSIFAPGQEKNTGFREYLLLKLLKSPQTTNALKCFQKGTEKKKYTTQISRQVIPRIIEKINNEAGREVISFEVKKRNGSGYKEKAYYINPVAFALVGSDKKVYSKMSENAILNQCPNFKSAFQSFPWSKVLNGNLNNYEKVKRLVDSILLLNVLLIQAKKPTTLMLRKKQKLLIEQRRKQEVNNK